MKSHFSDLIHLLRKSKLPKCTFDLMYLIKLPTDEKIKLRKGTVATKILNE